MRLFWLGLLALLAVPAAAQAPPVQSYWDAISQDAAEYARLHAVAPDEAVRRLQAQQASVPAIRAIAAAYRDRLAGIVLEHAPAFRFAVHLTGDEPVPDTAIQAASLLVPVVFVPGAAATRVAVVDAIRFRQAAINAALPHPPGMGADPANGTLALVIRQADVAREGADALAARIAAVAGVPVTVREIDRRQANLAQEVPPAPPLVAPAPEITIEGGARVQGHNDADGHDYICSTGFTVTDGTRDGVLTAAHCLDQMHYVAPDRAQVPLTFVGQWGWGYHDVQVHIPAAAATVLPRLYADTAKTVSRPVTSWRPRDDTRAGDFVCHRGERTGYSCAEVELIDYAPPGDLCGGACMPTWVTVAGPTCQGGDSGSPVFAGEIAFGIVKGASYDNGGGCNFYYYMSVDYLPPPWTLKLAAAP